MYFLFEQGIIKESKNQEFQLDDITK